MRRFVALAFTALAMLAFAGSAGASQLIDRNASNVRLKVSRDGKAMVSYRAHGRSWDVLAWGAVNALHPNQVKKQVQFKLDRAGGWGTFGKKLRFKNACRRYDGPALVHLVTACKAPDGSYWALQRWQRRSRTWGSFPGCPSSAHGRSTSRIGAVRSPSSRAGRTGPGTAGTTRSSAG